MTGSRCVVTGANRGLGLEFVRQLLARGDEVLAGCRDPAAATALAALDRNGRLQVAALDVADAASRAAFVAAVEARFDGLDLLVNNAGMLVPGERFGAVTQDTLARSFAVNAAGPFLLTQALAPRLAFGRRPRVANISSGMGSIARLEGFHAPSYSISKTALNMASALLAKALNPLGIGVLTLSPGWVRTGMGGESAPLTPERSVAGLLQVIDAAPHLPAGTFLDHDGTPLRW
jgi:NAD(P)-dependent dehydrogenase (short-subunit alcohol dehydrogenase family)